MSGRIFKQIIILISFGFIFIQCNNDLNENYPNDPKSADINNEPIDSATFYFPFTIKKNDSIVKTNVDSFYLSWYSRSLNAAGEKILFNTYEGHDIYRFLWLRAFHPPVVFSLNKDGDKIWLQTKQLDRHPPLPYGGLIVFADLKGNRDSTNYHEKDSMYRAESLIQPKIVSTETKNLSINEWNKFEILIENCGFWSMSPTNESSGVDGSRWIIESHLKEKYWFADRFAPKDNFRKCGEYLIELSGIEEEVY